MNVLLVELLNEYKFIFAKVEFSMIDRSRGKIGFVYWQIWEREKLNKKINNNIFITFFF